MSDRIGSWTRYTPVPRNPTFEKGLRAPVHDPLWLLTRQWQLRELRGSDAGTPIDVDVNVAYDRIETVHLQGDGVAGGTTAIPYEGGPLEPLVEREPVVSGSRQPGARTRVETGREFRRRLAEAAGGDPGDEAFAVETFPEALFLEEPTEPMAPEDRRFFSVMADRSLDGYELYRRLSTAATNLDAVLEDVFETGGDVAVDGGADDGDDSDQEPVSLEVEPGVDDAVEDLSSRPGFAEAAAGYLRWYRTLYDEPFDGTDDPFAEDAPVRSAWRPTRFEYDADVETQSGAVFDLTEYEGGRLDRDNFVLTEPGELDPGAVDGESIVDSRLFPHRIDFPGMPSGRWWSFTESSIALGDLSGDGAPLPYLLVLDYAVEYGSDWFSVPIQAPLGTYVRITDCAITDTFGVVQEAIPVQDDRWRLYMCRDEERPGLFLPPTLSTAEASEPVEEVLFGRDEMANLVFGLERLIEGPTGRRVDRSEFDLPEVVVESVRPATNADDESLTLRNPGDDALNAGTVAVRAIVIEEVPDAGAGGTEMVETAKPVYTFDADGEHPDHPDGLVLGPGESITLCTGESDEDGTISAGKAEGVWDEADAVDVVDVGDELDLGSVYESAWERAGVGDAESDLEDALGGEDALGIDHEDGSLLARKLLKRPDADGAYHLVTSVPSHWFPFEMEYLEGGLDGAVAGGDGAGASNGDGIDELDPVDVLFADPSGYVLTQALLLDADSLDAGLLEIPRPLGRILDPESAELPPNVGQGIPYWMYEEEVTRAGREVSRRYQLARWGDGSVHLWSERAARVGVGELASGLRFDVLEE